MPDLRKELIKKLELLPDVRVGLWKDSDLLCVFCRGKEIAHFQNHGEIDIRLTPAIIKLRGLRPPVNTVSHVGRSKNSRWIVQSFAHEGELDGVVELVRVASAL